LLALIASSVAAFKFRIGKFNSSVWDAVFILWGIYAFVFLYSLRSICKKGGGEFLFFDAKHYFKYLKTRVPQSNPLFLDPGEEGDTFKDHNQRYTEIAKLILASSGAAIGFIINTLVGDKNSPSNMMVAIRDVAPIVIGYFGISIALLLLFMILQTTWYEEYSSSPSHSTYQGWKYAMCLALGWTGLLAFSIGIFWLVANLFPPGY
jgi:hypothetical protein